MTVEKSGSGSVEPEDFNALVDAFNEGGNGGSQLDLIGPYHVDYTDIENDQDDLVLFTPTTGQIVLAAFIDPRTAVPVVSEGAAAMLVGQATELSSAGDGPPTSGNAAWCGIDTDLIFDNFRAVSTNAFPYPTDVPDTGYQARTAPMFPLDEDVICRNNSGADLTAGAIDVYFLIKTATAPS